MPHDSLRLIPAAKVVVAPASSSDLQELVAHEVTLLGTWVNDRAHGWDERKFTGQELEFVVVDAQTLRPASVSQELLPALAAELGDTFGSELLQTNVEMSTTPRQLGLGCLAQGERDITDAWNHAQRIAARSGNTLFAGGMYPLYTLQDFADTALLYPERYEHMNQILMSRNNGSVTLKFIEEAGPLTFRNFTFEGAPTSHQVHLSASPDELVRLYNASLAIMGPLIAVSANSPVFCGMTSWHESRIPLLEQGSAGDRFIFSTGFAAKPSDLFSDVTRFPPLTYLENGREVLLGKKKDDGCDPRHLPAFQAQNGTVWKWLRSCYAHNGTDVPHVRLEQRVLPAGPTPIDMTANAAFLIGSVHGLLMMPNNPIDRLPFEGVKDNFYAGARHGLDADMTWTERTKVKAHELVSQLIPIARLGLNAIGVSEAEISRYIDVIEHRVANKQTGSGWFLKSVQSLEAQGATREKAVEETTRAMIEWQQRNLAGESAPVHTWPVL